MTDGRRCDCPAGVSRLWNAIQKIQTDSAPQETQSEDDRIDRHLAMPHQKNTRHCQRRHAGQADEDAVPAEVEAAQRTRHNGGDPRQPRAHGNAAQRGERQHDAHCGRNQRIRRGYPTCQWQDSQQHQRHNPRCPAAQHQPAIADALGIRRNQKLQHRRERRQTGQQPQHNRRRAQLAGKQD